jgi:hypothetical protein
MCHIIDSNWYTSTGMSTGSSQPVPMAFAHHQTISGDRMWVSWAFFQQTMTLIWCFPNHTWNLITVLTSLCLKFRCTLSWSTAEHCVRTYNNCIAHLLHMTDTKVTHKGSSLAEITLSMLILPCWKLLKCSSHKYKNLCLLKFGQFFSIQACHNLYVNIYIYIYILSYFKYMMWVSSFSE